MSLSRIRYKVFTMVEKDERHSLTSASHLYDLLMLLVIIASIVPLGFRKTYVTLSIIEYGCVAVFIVDYLLRWFTCDYKLQKGWRSFLLYPFTGMAIVDLLSIIPTFTTVNNAFVLFRLTRLVRIIRILKIARYSKEIQLFVVVLYRQRSVLLSVLYLACIYILFTALLMFNVDEQFENFFDALYWATTALTTVGYGDVCPHNDVGRFVSMLSSLVGVAVIALPSGVITASYLKMIEDLKSHKNEHDEANP